MMGQPHTSEAPIPTEFATRDELHRYYATDTDVANLRTEIANLRTELADLGTGLANLRAELIQRGENSLKWIVGVVFVCISTATAIIGVIVRFAS